MNSRPSIPSLLLISGTGQNSGKTLLACKIIQEAALRFPVSALKISPHEHGGGPDLPIYEQDGAAVWQEACPPPGKDTARMKEAGAAAVYYIQGREAGLQAAVHWLLEKIGRSSPIVCESGGLWHCFQPGVFLMARNPHAQPKTASLSLLPHAHAILSLEQIQSPAFASPAEWDGSRWILKA